MNSEMNLRMCAEVHLTSAYIYIYIYICIYIWESFCGVVANMLECDIVQSEFELQSGYNVHFRTNRTIGIIVLLISFYKDGFGIK